MPCELSMLGPRQLAIVKELFNPLYQNRKKHSQLLHNIEKP